jgi:hypothetical protein
MSATSSADRRRESKFSRNMFIRSSHHNRIDIDLSALNALESGLDFECGHGPPYYYRRSSSMQVINFRISGDPGGARTPNPQFRRLMLYPIELRGRSFAEGPAYDNPAGLRKKIWGGKRESNPQPPEPQSGALPVELFPPQPVDYSNGSSVRDRTGEGL